MNDFLQKKLKILIIIVIIFIVIISVVIIANIFKENKKVQEYLDTNPYDYERQVMVQDIGTNDYLTVQKCISKFYDYIYDLYNTNSHEVEIDSEYQKERARVILGVLNNKYVQDNNLNEQDIIEKYNNYEFNEFLIDNIYLTQSDKLTSVYLVYGKQINDLSKKSMDYGYIVILDGNNSTFSIAPYEYMKELKLDNLTVDDKVEEIVDVSKIIPNDDNSNLYSRVDINEQELVKTIFKDYKLIAKYNAPKAYDLLDKEYREKRFEDSESGEKYLKDTLNEVLGYKLEKLSIDESNDNYTRYVCLDNNGNYFIIKKDDQLMKYSIYLDMYTISMPEVVKVYNKANDAKKAAVNLEKFKQMINIKDYESAYNVLDETFRNENFGNVEKFRKYIEDNWPEFINITYDKCNEVGELWTLNGYISERNVSEEELEDVVSKTFVVKLIDENNFVMSFNIE